ncbi:hypothetical protein HFM94_05280 [Faecalicatena fissicatena]|nr:hypothetical protein [Lachnospiraceae bacterium]NSE32700.1 hypothetical protein [Faecalicatena fissicatena]HAJ39226.1 hypothetical protein [Lachnospiraceae bacterium]
MLSVYFAQFLYFFSDKASICPICVFIDSCIPGGSYPRSEQ